MRRLIASTFVSLDGIMQAPGGPEEDLTGGFAQGGWTFNYWDEAVDISAAGFDGKGRELVLGRKTYEIFEAYWPYQHQDDAIARTLNAAKKHVASRTLTTLHWNNATLLRGDVVPAITALKAQPGPDLQIIGSGDLMQTLQPASLIDEYNVWTFPVVLGHGKRLFGATAKPSALRLLRSSVSGKGVVISVYAPDGDVRPGSFVSGEPSEKELARRKKAANEARAAEEASRAREPALDSKEMRMDEQRPMVAMAHVVLETDRMEESARFMQSIGMRPVCLGPQACILELRGGTHLILMPKDKVAGGAAPFDLMVDDIHATHRQFTSQGLCPSPIEARPAIDHEVFTIREPAGYVITIFSSHVSGKPV